MLTSIEDDGGDDLISLFNKLLQHYDDVNQDLVEECIKYIELCSNNKLRDLVYDKLIAEPSILLFNLAIALKIEPTQSLYEKVYEEPTFLTKLLIMINNSNSDNRKIFLTMENWNSVLKLENLFLLEQVIKFVNSLEDKEEFLLKLDYNLPFTLLLLEKACNDLKLVTMEVNYDMVSIEKEKVVEKKNVQSSTYLTEAIDRAVSFNYYFEDCHCSKHHECHDY